MIRPGPVYTMRPHDRVCIYNDRLVVMHPNFTPFYIDLHTRERVEIELGDEAMTWAWQTEIDGICKST